MENTTKIHALKEKIKMLSSEQHLLKKARKTTMPKDQWEAIRVELKKPRGREGERSWTPQDAAWEAAEKSTRITVCLNYYHELRGSKYRHGDSEQSPNSRWLLNNYWYGKYMTELKAELAKV